MVNSQRRMFKRELTPGEWKSLATTYYEHSIPPGIARWRKNIPRETLNILLNHT